MDTTHGCSPQEPEPNTGQPDPAPDVADAGAVAPETDVSAGEATAFALDTDKRRKVAVVTMGVKLAHETRGYTRFKTIAEMLVAAGFDVDLITSNFQHWDKAFRDVDDPRYADEAFRVVFVEEPGYEKNLDLKRIRSHRTAARNLRRYLAEHAGDYDLIYCEIPPNDVARAAAEAAHAAGIPFVADVNDLWPEAMRMVVDIPVVSDIAFLPFSLDARRTYKLLTAAVGTSEEYARRPLLDRSENFEHAVVYVGNDLDAFDRNAEEHAGAVDKPEGEFWLIYTGCLGASYDLSTLVEASALVRDALPQLRVKVLGDGPDADELRELATRLSAPVDFLGYVPYEQMCAWVCAADATINSLVADAPQSIPTKIGDYLAAGKPLVNTGSSPEFRCKVKREGFGVSVPAGEPELLASTLQRLVFDREAREEMGLRARAVARRDFDRKTSYGRIVALVDKLTSGHGHADSPTPTSDAAQGEGGGRTGE